MEDLIDSLPADRDLSDDDFQVDSFRLVPVLCERERTCGVEIGGVVKRFRRRGLRVEFRGFRIIFHFEIFVGDGIILAINVFDYDFSFAGNIDSRRLAAEEKH